jgi:ZIP family zinc transporter
MVIILAACTFLSTLFGGLFALRFQDRLHLILGFCAGSVLGVTFFDLLPESFQLNHSVSAVQISSMIALGFILYLTIHRLVDISSETAIPKQDSLHGHFGAATFSIHSLLDGVAIGLAFRVSPQVGTPVAAAILCHDFSDGMNTVNIAASHGIGRRSTIRWLIVDAATPFIGTLLTYLLPVPIGHFGSIMAVFCGFFLYIGASELLPESQHSHPGTLTLLITLAGVGLLYAVTQIVNR